MKYLDFYKKRGIPREKVFDYLMDNPKESIFTWEYLTDFKKVIKNIEKIETELNILNVLIGKENSEKKFIELITEFPKTRKLLPILVAVRNKKLKEFKIIDDFEEMVPEYKLQLFDTKVELTSEIKKDLLVFFNRSGLKQIFEDKNIKNLVDYCFGIEVGMDTNARKNRTGTSMELVVEEILKRRLDKTKFDYISQATKKKISSKWAVDILIKKTNKAYDFAILNKKTKKVFIIEVNYYGSQGSKLKSTAGEYQPVNDFLKKQNIDFIWITDGQGWNSAKKALYETFLHNDYVFNLHMLEEGILDEVLK